MKNQTNIKEPKTNPKIVKDKNCACNIIANTDFKSFVDELKKPRRKRKEQ